MSDRKVGQVGAFRKRLEQYFDAYGGWRAVVGSPLFLLSAGITLLSYDNWLRHLWVDQTFTLIPSLLGFSLGTYAILFGLITSRLKRALRAVKNARGTSYLDEINATFFHFILVQVLALMWAFLYAGTWMVDLVSLVREYDWVVKAYHGIAIAGSLVGLLLLMYSVALVIAAALAVYRLARIVDPAD